jgi:hypothetical protein
LSLETTSSHIDEALDPQFTIACGSSESASRVWNSYCSVLALVCARLSSRACILLLCRLGRVMAKGFVKPFRLNCLRASALDGCCSKPKSLSRHGTRQLLQESLSVKPSFGSYTAADTMLLPCKMSFTDELRSCPILDPASCNDRLCTQTHWASCRWMAKC